MGRKLAFDKDEALHKAMESFWVKGYKKTSMRELAGRLELHLGSVYNSLGSKEDVFEQALRLYFEVHVHPKLAAMKAHPHPLAAIDKYLSDIAEECGRPERSFGCFLVNSLHEITKINADITAFVHESIRRQEEAFADAIAEGQRIGDIDASKDAQKLGRFIVATMFSMWAMVKMGVEGSKIRDVKDCAIQAIRI